MTDKILILPILIPLAAAILTFIIPKGWRYIKEAIALSVTAAALFVAAGLFGKNLNYTIPWAGFGFEFSLRSYAFSSFIIYAL